MGWIYLLISILCAIAGQAAAQQNMPAAGSLTKASLRPENQMESKLLMNQDFSFSHYQKFYRQNFTGNILLASNYSGFQGQLTRSETDRIVLGLAFQFNQVVTSNQSQREYYRELQSGGQYLFVPFLLNVKFHLADKAEVGNFVPYLTAGLGPALGLYFPRGNNFFNTLGAISGEIGGGGFLGLGVDFLWLEEWALSLETRYNYFRFSEPLGADQEYKGISFFLGFSRALDY